MSLPLTTTTPSLTYLRQALPEWPAYENFYQVTLHRDVYRQNWLLRQLTRFLFRQKGKQIRPLTLLYFAKACGEITEVSLVAATLVEILHNATLAHDDVVDDADYRRGFFSFRALWGNRVAVLWGDWLLARGLLIALRYNEPQLLRYTSEAVEALAEGELLQLKRMREANLTLESYYEVIDKKTAALFQATAKMGAYSAGASPEGIELAGAIGLRIGRGFQIRDDLLDWADSKTSGKPTDADRQQRRFTLPLLWAISRASAPERQILLYGPFPKARTLLSEMGAFHFAETTLESLYQEALTLAQQLPHPNRVPLLSLFHLLLFREK
jgi:octaprenyl-diphosphate synthase